VQKKIFQSESQGFLFVFGVLFGFLIGVFGFVFAVYACA